MRKRSPQEKKALSYVKDRRNTYAENDKNSRKSIRRNKRFPNRAERHREHQVMTAATGPVELDAAEEAETRLQAKKPKRWRKWPDTPLHEIVADQLRRRAARGMGDAETNEAAIERIERRLGRRRGA